VQCSVEPSAEPSPGLLGRCYRELLRLQYSETLENTRRSYTECTAQWNRAHGHHDKHNYCQKYTITDWVVHLTPPQQRSVFVALKQFTKIRLKSAVGAWCYPCRLNQPGGLRFLLFS
jgi:hypothetical protein